MQVLKTLGRITARSAVAILRTLGRFTALTLWQVIRLTLTKLLPLALITTLIFTLVLVCVPLYPLGLRPTDVIKSFTR